MAQSPVDQANRYIRDVLSGKKDACKWVKLACQRQLDDLETGPPGMPDARFNPARANHVADFFKLCRHVKGPLARQPIKLEPWQHFKYTTVYGWEHPVQLPDGTGIWGRRYRMVYEEVPRKNAKSTGVAPLCLYALKQDGEFGADVYTAATSFKQAKVVFKIAKNMLAHSPLLAEGLDRYTDSIAYAVTQSLMEPLHAKADGLEGLNPYFASLDELHVHRTPEVWNAIVQGVIGRIQYLIWAITTAGDNTDGICYDMHGYSKLVLEKQVVDPSFWAIIYTIDEGDDWRDEKVWAKANPNLGVSFLIDALRDEFTKVIASPRGQSAFKTKHLNIWVGALDGYFNLEEWDACADPTLSLDDFEGQPCWVGVDAATKRDLTAMVILFKKEMETTHIEMRLVRNPDGSLAWHPETNKPLRQEVTVPDTHYYVFTKFYLPEFTVKDSHNRNRTSYEKWAGQGHLTLTSGSGTDFSVVENDLLEIQERFDLQEVPYDPYQQNQLAMNMIAEGIEMVEFLQRATTLSEPTKYLDVLLGDGFFHHDGNPILRWNIGNTVAEPDHNDNVFPKKENKNSHKKIDGTTATIMALDRARLRIPVTTSVYEERGLRTL